MTQVEFFSRIPRMTSLQEWREMCSGPEVAPPLVPLECLDGGEVPDFWRARELSGARISAALRRATP